MAGISIGITIDWEKIPEIEIDEGQLSQWLQERLDDARNHFITSASGPAPSAPGAYPGLRTGQLVGSVNVEVSGRSGSVGSDVNYAGFLASGTRKMAARKMLAEALDETLSARPEADKLAQAVKWVV